MTVRPWSGFPPVGLLLLGLASCAPGPAPVPLDISAVDAPTLLRMVRSRAALVQTLEGFGSVSFDSPEFSGTAAFDLSLRKPDSLLIMLEGPFGIDIGTLFLSAEEYVALNAQENVVVTGVPGTSTIRAIIPFDLTFREVLDAFSGSFRLPGADDELVSYGVDDDRFHVVARCAAGTCAYWIDHRAVQVARLDVTDDAGDLIFQAKASSFVEDGDAVVPRRIVLWFPQERKQIDVLYSSVTINPGNPSFSYTLPPDARVVRR